VDTQTKASTQLTHSLSLSHSLSSSSLSLYPHTLKQGEGREGEGKEGRFGVAIAGDGHGDHLEALICKR
jgi:hypothetical protein